VQIGGQSDEAASIHLGSSADSLFPQIAIRVLQLTNNEDKSTRQLTGLISSEPLVFQPSPHDREFCLVRQRGLVQTSGLRWQPKLAVRELTKEP